MGGEGGSSTVTTVCKMDMESWGGGGGGGISAVTTECKREGIRMGRGGIPAQSGLRECM